MLKSLSQNISMEFKISIFEILFSVLFPPPLIKTVKRYWLKITNVVHASNLEKIQTN
jgi:hypothetical protein